MKNYICIKTFVTDYGEFKRYYYGQKISQDEYLMLTPNDQKCFNYDK